MNGLVEAERIRDALTAIPGALLYGVYHLVALALSGQPATVRDYAKAVVNLFAAVGTGGVLAYFFTRAITAWIPIAALRDHSAVAFTFGVLGWEMLPVVINVARGRLNGLGGRQQ